jgi:hypothetical protein
MLASLVVECIVLVVREKKTTLLPTRQLFEGEKIRIAS